MKHKISTMLFVSLCSAFSFYSAYAMSQSQFICDFKYSGEDEAFLTIDNTQENGHRMVSAGYISFLGVSHNNVLRIYLEDRETKENLLSGNVNLEKYSQEKYFFYDKKNQINAFCEKLSH